MEIIRAKNTRIFGTRIKRQMGAVAIKMYDKFGLILFSFWGILFFSALSQNLPGELLPQLICPLNHTRFEGHPDRLV